MPLSCADYSWPLLTHETALGLIAGMGLDAVDIGLFHGATHVRPEQVADDPSWWAGVITERTERHGLVVADVFLTPGPDLATRAPNHPEPDQRGAALDMLRSTVDFAVRVGAPGITVLPGVRFDEEPYGSAIERAAPTLSEFVEAAGERGLGLSVEPHSGSCIDTPDRTMSLVEQVPGLTLTLDPGHFVFDGIEVAAMIPLLPFTRHVQVRGGAPGVMQSTVAANAIDFGPIIAGLSSAAYAGYVAMEYVWIDAWDCKGVDNVSETILMAAEIRALDQPSQTARATPTG